MDGRGEIVVMSLVLFRVLFCLAYHGFLYELAGLLFIAFVAFFVEHIASQYGVQHFHPRQGTSPGIYLAALLVPLVLTARMVQHMGISSDLREFETSISDFWSGFASSVGLLIFVWQNLKCQNKLVRITAGNDGKTKAFFSTATYWTMVAVLATFLAVLFPVKLASSVFQILISTMLLEEGVHTFPGCASLGEAILVANGLAVYVGNAFGYMLFKVGTNSSNHFFAASCNKDNISAILQAILIGLSCVPQLYKLLGTALYRIMGLTCIDAAKAKATTEKLYDAAAFFLALVLGLVVATGWLYLVHGMKDDLLTWVIGFVLEDFERLCLCGYWAAVLCTSVLPFYLSKSTKVEQIMIRKVFHVMVVIMFVPAILIQPSFLKLAFSVALAGFLVIEMIRVWRVPPLGKAVHNFMTTFTDSRDSDILIISHFSLLLGCALPLWLTNGKAGKQLAPFAGILGLGIGDTMASVIGYNYGSCRLSSSNKKTLEGTVAGVLSMLLACLVLHGFMNTLPTLTTAQLASLILSVLCTGLMEAYTTQLDNAFIPLIFYALLSI